MTDCNMSDVRIHCGFNFSMTLKHKKNNFNVISVPKLFENEVGPITLDSKADMSKVKKMSKNLDDNAYFGGHIGFGGHFECLMTLKSKNKFQRNQCAKIS